MPKGRYSAQAAIPAILGDEENGLPSLAREMIHDLWLCIQQANDQILSYDRAPSYLRAVVALAARNARLIWTLMMKQENYSPIMTK